MVSTRTSNVVSTSDKRAYDNPPKKLEDGLGEESSGFKLSEAELFS
jgi:hypothetical protein